ncbi:MAG: PH domain-containing protein [Candidatus Zambryskibacteria bacterium]|nr:PH domain-containing protein [Candidatus Zambryskibacteria bacterium]
MIEQLFSIFTKSALSFQEQEEGERVILVLRQHYFVIVLPLTLFAIVALFPTIIWFVFHNTPQYTPLEEVFWFVSSVWYLLLWLIAFYHLTMYTLNIVIITNHRIIEFEQLKLFNRKVAELHVHKVQDVSTHTHGLIETILSYGDIVVQTAASKREFIFKRIPNPEDVKDTIMQLVNSKISGTEPL